MEKIRLRKKLCAGKSLLCSLLRHIYNESNLYTLEIGIHSVSHWSWSFFIGSNFLLIAYPFFMIKYKRKSLTVTIIFLFSPRYRNNDVGRTKRFEESIREVSSSIKISPGSRTENRKREGGCEHTLEKKSCNYCNPMKDSREHMRVFNPRKAEGSRQRG